MSMAMAATLFATNSITIFAEEGDPIEVISVEPAADAATEESTNEPQVSPTDGLPAPEVEEYVDNFPPFEDQSDTTENVIFQSFPQPIAPGVVEVNKVVSEETNVYYSDKEDVEANGALGNDNVYSEVSSDQIDKENDKVDYVENEISSTPTFDSTVYLIDKDGNKAYGLKANGEKTLVQLSGDLEKTWLQPVEVMITEDKAIHELDMGDFSSKNLVYGYIKDGEFVKAPKNDHNASWFYVNGEGLQATETLYYYLETTEVNVPNPHWPYKPQTQEVTEKVYVDEDVYNAIKSESSEDQKYEKVVEYTYNGQDIEKEDLDKLKEAGTITDLDQWGYTIPAVEEDLGDEQTLKKDNGNKITVKYQKMVVTGVDTKNRIISGKCYFEYADENGVKKQYVAEESLNAWAINVDAKSVKAGETIALNYKKKSKSVTAKEVLVEAQEEKKVTSVVVIKDGDTELWRGTEEAFEAIKSEKYTKVDKSNKLRAELKPEKDTKSTDVMPEKDTKCIVEKPEYKPEYVYIDPACYLKLRENIAKYEVTHAYFYTVQDKNEVAGVVPVTIGDQTYELTVNFWENNRIGKASIEVVEPSEDNPEITDPYLRITFSYATYDEYGKYLVKEVTIDEPEATKITVDAFGPTGKGSIEIKYTPEYNTIVLPKKPERPVEPKKPQVREVKLMAANYLDSRALPMELLLTEEELEKQFDELPENDGNIHWARYMGPAVKFTPTPAEPTPNPGPNPDVTPERAPWITTAAIEETPVALAATVAPAGQVLGAQREESTGEAPAVLGASRARGTADETTAPFVRVLVMAAVASAALFLTRKREEKN
jgi:hypothetical protein